MRAMDRVVIKGQSLTGKKKKRKVRAKKKLANKKTPAYDQQGGY